MRFIDPDGMRVAGSLADEIWNSEAAARKNWVSAWGEEEEDKEETPPANYVEVNPAPAEGSATEGEGKKEGEKPSEQGGTPGFNIDNAVNYLNGHAYPKYDKATCGKCAKAVRLSLEAGGINTSNRPNSAKDYGPYLQNWGFGTVDKTGYSPLKGDIRVFQNYTGGSIHGHINMYNGNQWVSDFFENGFWPGRGYRENNAAFTIYRWGE